MKSLDNGKPLHVTEYPAAWRVEVINDGLHRGFEYLRWEPELPGIQKWFTNVVCSFYWGFTQMTWDHAGYGSNGTKVRYSRWYQWASLTDSPLS